jgi:hypothetical protein
MIPFFPDHSKTPNFLSFLIKWPDKRLRKAAATRKIYPGACLNRAMSTATIATIAKRTAPIMPNMNQPAMKTIPDDNPSIPQFADIGMVDPFVFQGSRSFLNVVMHACSFQY